MTALPMISEPIPVDDEAGLGCLRTGRGNLPLHAVDVDARITALLHETRVRQTFSNPYDEPIEATYIFPLPDRAAVTAFRMEVGERVVEGELQERGQARQAYDNAVATGHRAAIAEEERPNVFTVRVGNLMPGDRATVQLTLAGQLGVDSGEATWRFPLVVAPRYIPGTPLPGPSVGDGTAVDTDAVPDASRITPPVLLPGFPNPVALSMRVALDPAGLPVGPVRSTLAADLDEGIVTVRPGQRLDRDFALRFDLDAEAVTTSAVAHGDVVAVTIVPPSAPASTRPRDVVFVLDRSGSMQGWKMTAARRAVARMVDTLGAGDRFTVIAFDDRIETFQDGLVAGTDRLRYRAVEHLARLDARGGTELLEPLRQAIALLSDRKRERVLVLATDGQVGNEDQILAEIDGHGVRVFTVGIDTAVNDAFLRRLAAAGGGACEVVESEDRLDAVMDRIHRRIGTPVLTGLQMSGLSSIAPARVTALHAGAPLTVFGKLADGPVKVTATGPDGRPWSVEVPVGAGAEAIGSVWARARVRDLEDRYAVVPDPNIEREIVRTSLDGHVLSRFTAFVAIETSVVNEGGANRRVTQPVDAPAGWGMFDDGTLVGGPTAGRAYGGAAPMQPMAAAAPMMAKPTSAMPPPSMPPSPMPAPAYSSSVQPGAAVPPPPPTYARPGIGGLIPPLRRRPAGRPDAEKKRAKEKVVALDLTPYRERAGELLRRATAGEIDAYALRRDLTDLVDDLRSVGADDDVTGPLARALTGLAGLAGPADGPGSAGWNAVLDALRDFSGDRRASFWRR